LPNDNELRRGSNVIVLNPLEQAYDNVLSHAVLDKLSLAERHRLMILHLFSTLKLKLPPSLGNALAVGGVASSSIIAHNSSRFQKIVDAVFKGLYAMANNIARIMGANEDSISLAIMDIKALRGTFIAALVKETPADATIPPGIGDGLKIGAALTLGLKQGVRIYQTQGLEKAVKHGTPLAIITAVRQNMKSNLAEQMANSAISAVQLTLTMTAPFARILTGLISSIYSLVSKIVEKIVTQAKLYTVISEAIKLKSSQKYLQQHNLEFQTWFKERVVQLPILASLCMTSGTTGEILGFLNVIHSKNNFKADLMNQNIELARVAQTQMLVIKGEAAGFLRGFCVKFESKDTHVSPSLKKCYSGGLKNKAKNKVKTAIFSFGSAAGSAVHLLAQGMGRMPPMGPMGIMNPLGGRGY
jgi:hypothetical protein